jgi:hypothetical protein
MLDFVFFVNRMERFVQGVNTLSKAKGEVRRPAPHRKGALAAVASRNSVGGVEG